MKYKIPLITEVEAYIKEKKGWPDRFVKHYAERFWNHYQASGWKLSNGNAIKDWKACFNSQWQTPKFKEDIDAFNKMKIEKQPESGNRDIDYLNERLAQYSKHPTSISNESLNGLYDYLKAEKLLKLTREQIEIAKAKGPAEGKGLAVKLFFENMVREGINFSHLWKVKS